MSKSAAQINKETAAQVERQRQQYLNRQAELKRDADRQRAERQQRDADRQRDALNRQAELKRDADRQREMPDNYTTDMRNNKELNRRMPDNANKTRGGFKNKRVKIKKEWMQKDKQQDINRLKQVSK